MDNNHPRTRWASVKDPDAPSAPSNPKRAAMMSAPPEGVANAAVGLGFDSGGLVLIGDGRRETESGDDPEARAMDEWADLMVRMGKMDRRTALKCAAAIWELRAKGTPAPAPPSPGAEEVELSEHPRSAECEVALELRKAVLRLVFGYDNRTQAAVAEEFDVTRAAVSRIHAQIITKLGWKNLFSTPERRAKNERAARLRWRKEKARVQDTGLEPVIETGTENASSKDAAGVNDSTPERKAA